MAKFRYQHIKSSVEGKAPTAAQLKVAEIGVNDFAGDEKLFIKNSEGIVVDFPRGYSQADIDENERVIAEALNDLNSRKLDASAYTPTDLSNYYTKSETSGSSEIQDALDEKLDASAYTPTDLSNYYTKSETSGATEIKDALDEKADASDIPAVSGYADSVKYNSESHYVEFYHGTTAGTKVFEYDASPFLIDGMVEDVAVEDVEISGETVTCLVISFNTAAGKQDIDIPLSEIFDPSLYYTKEYIDENERVVAEALNDLNERKLDASAYTPTDLSNYYTKDETSGATEISTALAGKSDTSHTHDDRYYTKSEIDEQQETVAAALNDLESDKQDKLSAGTGIDITNNIISVTGGSTDVEEELEVIAVALNDLEDKKLDKADMPDYDEQFEVVAASLNDLEEKRQIIEANLEEIGETTAYALNDLECRKQNVLSAGTGIDITDDIISVVGGSSDVEEQLEVVAAALNDLEENKADKANVDEQFEVVAASLNDLESDKQDKLSAGTGIDITNNIISVTGGSTDVEEELEVIAAALNDLEENKANKADVDEQFEVVAASLNDLESNKASKSEDLDGIKLKKITQSDYDDLVSSGATDSNTLYIITD